MKEFMKNYNEWCAEGRKNKYGITCLLLLLPVFVFLFAVTYFCGYSTGYNTGRVDILHDNEVDEEPRYVNIAD